jgi:hypothetical protein
MEKGPPTGAIELGNGINKSLTGLAVEIDNFVKIEERSGRIT